MNKLKVLSVAGLAATIGTAAPASMAIMANASSSSYVPLTCAEATSNYNEVVASQAEINGKIDDNQTEIDNLQNYIDIIEKQDIPGLYNGLEDAVKDNLTALNAAEEKVSTLTAEIAEMDEIKADVVKFNDAQKTFFITDDTAEEVSSLADIKAVAETVIDALEVEMTVEYSDELAQNLYDNSKWTDLHSLLDPISNAASAFLTTYDEKTTALETEQSTVSTLSADEDVATYETALAGLNEKIAGYKNDIEELETANEGLEIQLPSESYVAYLAGRKTEACAETRTVWDDVAGTDSEIVAEYSTKDYAALIIDVRSAAANDKVKNAIASGEELIDAIDIQAFDQDGNEVHNFANGLKITMYIDEEDLDEADIDKIYARYINDNGELVEDDIKVTITDTGYGYYTAEFTVKHLSSYALVKTGSPYTYKAPNTGVLADIDTLAVESNNTSATAAPATLIALSSVLASASLISLFYQIRRESANKKA